MLQIKKEPWYWEDEKRNSVESVCVHAVTIRSKLIAATCLPLLFNVAKVTGVYPSTHQVRGRLHEGQWRRRVNVSINIYTPTLTPTGSLESVPLLTCLVFGLWVEAVRPEETQAERTHRLHTGTILPGMLAQDNHRAPPSPPLSFLSKDQKITGEHSRLQGTWDPRKRVRWRLWQGYNLLVKTTAGYIDRLCQANLCVIVAYLELFQNKAQTMIITGRRLNVLEQPQVWSSFHFIPEIPGQISLPQLYKDDRWPWPRAKAGVATYALYMCCSELSPFGLAASRERLCFQSRRSDVSNC